MTVSLQSVAVGLDVLEIRYLEGIPEPNLFLSPQECSLPP